MLSRLVDIVHCLQIIDWNDLNFCFCFCYFPFENFTCPQLKKSPDMKDRLGACLSTWHCPGAGAVTSDNLGMWWALDVDIIKSEDGDVELDKSKLSADPSSVRWRLDCRPVLPLPPPLCLDLVNKAGTGWVGTGLLAGKLDDVVCFNLAGLIVTWCFEWCPPLDGEVCRRTLTGDLTWTVVLGRTDPLFDFEWIKPK